VRHSRLVTNRHFVTYCLLALTTQTTLV